jgi:hypothetical protein
VRAAIAAKEDGTYILTTNPKRRRVVWFPLSRRAVLAVLRLLQEQGLQIKDVTLKAVHLFGEVEKTSLFRLALSFPPWFWNMLRPVLPTLFFVCAKKASSLPVP